MQIEVTGRKIELTPSIVEKVNSSFEKLNEHYSGLSAKLIFEKEHRCFRALAEYTCEHGEQFVASAEHEDLYQAINKSCDKLRGQLASNKRTH
ncbi:ribosome hibernation-promoting factor, HPF/YfiA family [Pseudomonas luteola]